MDPTAPLLEITDSFKTPYAIGPLPDVGNANTFPPVGNANTFPPSYTAAPTTIMADIRTAPAKEVPNLPADPRISDPSDYERLNKIKEAFSLPGFIEARDLTNPYEAIGKSIFITRAAVKLANIDAVFNILATPRDPLVAQYSAEYLARYSAGSPMGYSGAFSFVDIAAGPGGFSQYIMWRRTEARGFGMTLKPLRKEESHTDWNRRVLDPRRFTITYGPDKTGNLYTNWAAFLNEVLSVHRNGVDLLTGDGGFDVENMEVAPGQAVDFNYARQEFLSTRLIMAEIVVAINCLRIGGTAVIKIFDTVTSVMAQLIYLAALCFDRTTIFKPLSSRPANAERYLVLQGLRGPEVTEAVTAILEEALNRYTATDNVTNIIADMPELYLTWLREMNTQSIERQLAVDSDIVDVMNGGAYEPTVLNLKRALIVWNIPEGPKRREDRIRVDKAVEEEEDR